jgi:hypothetical protein
VLFTHQSAMPSSLALSPRAPCRIRHCRWNASRLQAVNAASQDVVTLADTKAAGRYSVAREIESGSQLLSIDQTKWLTPGAVSETEIGSILSGKDKMLASIVACFAVG